MGGKPSQPAPPPTSPAKEEKVGPLLKAACFPFAATHPDEYNSLVALFRNGARSETIDYSPLAAVTAEALDLLPTLLRVANKATTLTLDGLDMDCSNCLCLARSLSRSAVSTVSMRRCRIDHDRVIFLMSLLHRTAPKGGLEIVLEENAIWKDGDCAFNDVIQQQVTELVKHNVIIKVPPQVLPPLDVDGVKVPWDDAESKPYGPRGVLLEVLHESLDVKDWKDKLQYLRMVCERIMEKQKDPRTADDGSNHLPRIYGYYTQQQHRSISIAMERVTKNPAYLNLEKEFPANASRSGWPCRLRVSIAYQMALLAQFVHGLNTCIRGITPSTIYYRFNERGIEIVYTSIAVFREQNTRSTGHHVETYRFADPKESGADRTVKPPRDICAIFRFLHYLLCYDADPETLKQKHVVHPPPEADVLQYLEAHYRRQFVESLGEAFFPSDTLNRLANLMARGVQSDESARPTIDTVLTELHDIGSDAK